jgi:hypothetical protein
MAKKPKTYTRKTPLDQPLTTKDLRRCSAVDVVIEVDLSDLINCGHIDGLNDLADERIHDYRAGIMLCDIVYSVVGITPGRDGYYGAVRIRVQAQIERE